MKPNYHLFGYSMTMGPQLRVLVENQLGEDLLHYGVTKQELRFDWSDSCIEGHCTDHLDGSLDNYSGIAVYNIKDQLLAEGWMDFVHEGELFLVYWDCVTIYESGVVKSEKDFGMPDHIREALTESIRPLYQNKRWD